MAFRQRLGSQYNGASSASTVVVTLTASPASDGSYVAAVKGGNGNTVTGISDSKGNTWVVDRTGGTTKATVNICSCLAPTTPLASGDTITFTLGSTPVANNSAVVNEYDPLTALDASAAAVNTGNGTSLAVGPTGTTAQASETIVTATGIGATTNTTWTAPSSPWTEHGGPATGVNNIDIADQDVASIGTFSATWGWTGSTNSAAVIVTYQKASGGTGISGVGAIPSAEAFGLPHVIRILAAQGAVSAEQFGIARALRLLYPQGVASAEAEGVPHVLRALGLRGIGSAETFGAARLVRLLYPVGVASAEVIGRPSVIGGIQGPYTITGVGAIASAEAFGNADRLIRQLGAVAIPSAEAVGIARVVRVLAAAGAIQTAEAFGTARLVRVVGPTGIVSVAAVGQNGKAVRVMGSVGISSAETWGAPFLVYRQIVYPVGVGSGETFGTAWVGAPSKLIIGGDVSIGDLVLYSVDASEGTVRAVLISDALLDSITVSD